MVFKFRFLIILSLLVVGCGKENEFTTESDRISNAIGCVKPKITPGDGGLGALYSCIGGEGETVKVFINEEGNSGNVKNVKFMWNDWTKDLGDGVHADKELANSWVTSIAKLYAPSNEKEVVKSFFENTDRQLSSSTHFLEYTYRVGPAIDERLLVITSIENVKKQVAINIAAKSDYDSCRSAIAKAVQYDESSISGDGEPINQSGYFSFSYTGAGDDLFFCEVHPGGKYKVKAAINGKFPFKYIAQGDFR